MKVRQSIKVIKLSKNETMRMDRRIYNTKSYLSTQHIVKLIGRKYIIYSTKVVIG